MRVRYFYLTLTFLHIGGIMILLILGFIFLICSLILFYKANQIKINKNEEQENYKQSLNKQIYQLEQEQKTLINSQTHKKEEINQDLLEWREYRKKEIEALQKAKNNQPIKL